MKTIIAVIRGYLVRARYNYLSKNISIGRNLQVYKKLKITGLGKVTIGDNCLITGIPGDNSQYVTIDTHSKDARIRIGHNAGLYSARISSKYEISIGDNVLIEESTIIDTDFHSIEKDRGEPASESFDTCKVQLGNQVCIGARSLVLKGVTISHHAVILPGSIVSMSVNEGARVIGNPARPQRQ